MPETGDPRTTEIHCPQLQGLRSSTCRAQQTWDSARTPFLVHRLCLPILMGRRSRDSPREPVHSVSAFDLSTVQDLASPYCSVPRRSEFQYRKRKMPDASSSRCRAPQPCLLGWCLEQPHHWSEPQQDTRTLQLPPASLWPCSYMPGACS